MPRLISLREFAEKYFGSSKDAVWKRIRRGTLRIPYVQVGDNHRIYIRREHLEAWLDEHTHVVPPPADESKGSGEKPRTKRKKRSA